MREAALAAGRGVLVWVVERVLLERLAVRVGSFVVLTIGL